MKIFLTMLIVIIPYICLGQTHGISQTVEHIEYSSLFNNVRSSHVAITLKNESKEDYYFWIGRIPSLGCSPQKLCNSFFFGKRDMGIDYSFGNMIMEQDGLLGGVMTPQIGFSFIKLIKPQEKFYIIIQLINDYKFYNERFVFMPVLETQKYFGEIPETFLYKPICVKLDRIQIKHSRQQ